ncbi:uncharacterized protein LOC120486986 [Pimephales promelas]|uniref:uncharacterized protein LOC120486986 n=1 Tax=Pimephales promelas TaxID=90988 RepID=UPI0019556ADE|nr:uncharacterized protein LOC120486986 [Pimephales promelas]KAG1944984.1 protein SIX6OS1 [Pimephales promelas]
MEEQTVNQLDNLLLQLGIESRELAQRNNDLKQQLQICESNIQEKKDYIKTTQLTISKLDVEIQQKQNTVKFIKENTKNQQRTGHLLLQYEKTLEAELEKRQDSYKQDMKMFQERIESYRNVFQQYKDRYCQNPLAQKLLKAQAENEEIERRIRAIEEQIMEKDRELTAAMGEEEPVTDGADSKCPVNDGLQTESESFDEMVPHPEPIMQRPEEYADEHMGDEDPSEANKVKTAESESQMDTFSHCLWKKRETVEDQMQEGDQRQSEKQGNVNVSCASELMVEISEEEEEKDSLDTTTAETHEYTVTEGPVCPPPSPARIKATPNTPTFSLNNSPRCSPGGQDISDTKSPAFVFSMMSGPNTPAFSKPGCDFDVGSAPEEASPFTFTSSYFSNKKSPGSTSKFSDFLFDEAESRQEEFSFSFGMESPQKSSSTQDTSGPGDSFPFSFSFGKL